ncbi:hypothetical protein GCM10017750_63820 [Streptomyces racemochromogenes]
MQRLGAGELIAVFPEGVAGLEKPFRERYRLQPFDPGFAVAALHGAAPGVRRPVRGRPAAVLRGAGHGAGDGRAGARMGQRRDSRGGRSRRAP